MSDVENAALSEKSANFHRIATKRTDAIVDALRVFSNLSGPSYEWSPEEVMAYLGQIDAAQAEALARFKETKRWRTSAPAAIDKPEPVLPAQHDPAAELAEAEPVEDEPASDATPIAVQRPQSEKVAAHKGHPRHLTIAQIMTECEDDREMLAEMVRLQRMVIYDQAKRLGEDVEYLRPTAA
ncbi:MAG: hypothetical protein DI537_10210 [Stutzerimonas stutzeri]|nr:MAG: hypothetical protein DI537_10210 [Stutzerimonas stutzeri]